MLPFGVPILHRIVGARPKERPMAKLRPMLEAWPHRCTACKKQKPASDFQHCRRMLETPLHTRCKSCETCKECKRCFIDHLHGSKQERRDNKQRERRGDNKHTEGRKDNLHLIFTMRAPPRRVEMKSEDVIACDAVGLTCGIAPTPCGFRPGG